MTDSAIEHLVRLGQDFHQRGWVLGTSGNFSTVIGRQPLRLAITSSSVDKGRLTADQILEIDENGRILNGGSPGKPSAETLLHLAIAGNLQTGAVLHTHSVWSTVLSDYHVGSGGFFIEGYEMLKGLDDVRTHQHREWLPILENSQDMEELSARVATTLRQNPGIHGFLLREHGLYTWGQTLPEAKRHVEILEFLMEVVSRAGGGKV